MMIKNDQIFKFKNSDYEAVVNYYRKTNIKKRILERIMNWLANLERGYKLKIPRKYIYLSVEINGEISIELSGSNIKIDSYSDWNTLAEYKPKYRKLNIEKTEWIQYYEDILAIVKSAINDIILYYGNQSIIN